MHANDRIFVALGTLLVALVAVAAVAGAVHDYTGIPFYDMWSGYLGFFRRLSSGETSVWWAQHNEHRIVLARIVFWIDLAFFGGRGIFLVVVNFVLAAIIATIFAKLMLARTARTMTQPPRASRIAFALIVAAIVSSGAQWENYRWGFQSQFFLAQLVPLGAFLMLHRSTVGTREDATFAAACALGVMAAGTMANGVLTLPLMVLQAIAARMRWSRVAALAALSAAVLLLYFHGYEPSANHGSIAFELTHDPSAVVAYVLAYIGGPFAWLVGYRFDAPAVGIVAGIVFCALFVVVLRRIGRNRSDGVALALATFVFFIVATATGTAGGRLIFGLSQAVSSRYATPALMAWAAVVVLYAPAFVAFQVRKPMVATFLLVAFAGLMGVRHWKALPYGYTEPALQRLAALTLVLDVHDDEALAASAPDLEAARLEGRWIEPRRLSFFGNPMFLDARARIGSIAPATAGPRCEARVRLLEWVPGESRYLRVTGSILAGPTRFSSPILSVIDRDRRIVGVAVSGLDPERAKGDIEAGGSVGFSGYVLADGGVEAGLALVAADGSCETVTLMPPSIRQRILLAPLH